jgi:hypothetical protein
MKHWKDCLLLGSLVSSFSIHKLPLLASFDEDSFCLEVGRFLMDW